MTRALILALALAPTMAGQAAPLAANAESFERRMLRTIQIGAPQGVTVPEIVAYSKDPANPYMGQLLAIAALYVLDAPLPARPVDFTLNNMLDMLPFRSEPFDAPPGLPDEFDGAAFTWTLVYAMVLKGDTEKVLDALEKHLSGSRYSRAVVLQALRFIGGRRATDILQRETEKPDYWNLPEVLLGDHHIPFLTDLQERLVMLPPAERERALLFRRAQARCALPATMAVYFLGFFEPNPDRAAEEAELNLLRELARERSEACFHTRYFAVRSLALRSRESVPFWVELFRGEESAWLRIHLALIGYAHFRQEFLRPALELIATERSFPVRSELLAGNIMIREGREFRPYWDIWLNPRADLRTMFPRPDRPAKMEDAEVEELLAWVESHPAADITARNAVLRWVSPYVRGNRTRRLLRLVNALPERNTHTWVVRRLSDPAALPLLRYWMTLEPPRPAGQESFLEDAIKELERRSPPRPSSRVAPCCEPTRACLVEWVLAPQAEAEDVTITSEEEAAAWLARSAVDLDEADLNLEFQDPLERIAFVNQSGLSKPERWEHLYGCWVRVDPAPAPRP